MRVMTKTTSYVCRQENWDHPQKVNTEACGTIDLDSIKSKDMFIPFKTDDGPVVRINRKNFLITSPETTEDVEYLLEINEEIKRHSKVLFILNNIGLSRGYYFSDEEVSVLTAINTVGSQFENRCFLTSFVMDAAEEEHLEILIMDMIRNDGKLSASFCLEDYAGNILVSGDIDACFKKFFEKG